MKAQDFIPEGYNRRLQASEVRWEAPSNIALVKYWGKRDPQIPENPSLSFTLSECVTRTTLQWEPRAQTGEDFSFSVFFEGVENSDFRPKIQEFFKRVFPYVPFLKAYHFTIHTSNTFPHSSGIASSASGMSALAVCLLDMERELTEGMTDEKFRRKASFLARLGSGSASRSIEGPLVAWGAHEKIPGSTDLFGIPYPFEVDPVFRDYCDTILLVDKGEKQVSSTLGHKLMHGHPFAQQRFKQARNHLDQLQPILKSGDLDGFMKLVELEALSLHAMMLSSDPYFILMRPNTLEIINRIWEYRNSSGVPLCFTLDAGANVHALYPKNSEKEVRNFLETELSPFCQQGQMIHDRCGIGARQLP